jgi:hypothetical protein
MLNPSLANYQESLHCRPMERHSALVAVVLNAALLTVLAVTFVIDRDLADWLTREDAAVEWLQAVFFALAAVFAMLTARDRWRAGAAPVFEVLVTAMMAGLIIGEVDLDRVVAGRKIISTRFLVDASVWLGWRALALLVMALPPLALAVYVLRRWREFLVAIRRATTESSGRVFIAGVIIFGLTETFEKPLGRIPRMPRYMLEEVLELVAAICFAVALYAHWRLRPGEEKERPGAEEGCAPSR